MAPKFCPNFVPSLAKFQNSLCCAIDSSPYSPCPSVAGAAVARSALNPPPLAGVSWTLHKVGPKFGRVSLPYPPAVHRVSADPPPSVSSNSPSVRSNSFFFLCFFMSKIWSKIWTVQKLLFRAILVIFGRPGLDFRRFWVPKQVPGAYVCGVFF